MMNEPDVLNDLDQIASRYDLLGELCRDGASAVYRARSRRDGHEVAIRLLDAPPTRSARPGARHPWQARPVLQLRHPNLVDIYAVHHLQGGTVALAMDHGERPTLAELIRGQGPLPPRRVEEVLRSVGAALAYLHGSGVVHRNVRPQSILVDPETGCARLADFGLDRQEGDRNAAALRALAYVAPEQLDGVNQVDAPRVSAHSDIFSLALVGYAMLTGKQPWEGAALTGLAEARSREALAWPADTPEPLLRALQGAVQVKPGRRWKSVADFLAQLDGTSVPERGVPLLNWGSARAGAGRAAASARTGLTAGAAALLAGLGSGAGALRGEIGSRMPVLRRELGRYAPAIPGQLGKHAPAAARAAMLAMVLGLAGWAAHASMLQPSSRHVASEAAESSALAAIAVLPAEVARPPLQDAGTLAGAAGAASLLRDSELVSVGPSGAVRSGGQGSAASRARGQAKRSRGGGPRLLGVPIKSERSRRPALLGTPDGRGGPMLLGEPLDSESSDG